MKHAGFHSSAIPRAMILTGLLAPLLCLGSDRVNLDVKLGLWEAKIKTTNSGMPEMSSQMKARMEQSQKRMNEQMKEMTPEQRAGIEAAIKRQGQPTQHIRQNCITKEKLEQGTMLSRNEGMDNCKSVMLQNDSNNLVMKMTCTASPEAREEDAGMTSATGAGEILVKYSVVSSTSLKGTMDMKMDAGGGKFFSSHSDMEDHWLGANCQGKK